MLTLKFGKPQSRHRPRACIGLRVLDLADGNYQLPVVGCLVDFFLLGFLVDLVKLINQLKKAYPEEAEFKKDAAYQFIY